MNDISFRDWRRTEELARDLTEGFLDNGKRCVHTFPWQEDPVIEEQGSWSLSPCATPRSFVCQHSATTRNVVIRVTGSARFQESAEFFGGVLQLNFAEILSLQVSHATVVTISPKYSDADTPVVFSGINIIETMLMADGASLHLEGPRTYFGLGNVRIGEVNLAGQQSSVKIGPHVHVYFNTSLSTATGVSPFSGELVSSQPAAFANVTAVISARLESSEGSIFVATGVTLELGQVRFLTVFMISYHPIVLM